ncbi:MAG: hypothetical protein KDE35_13195 [Geminicoccaceae bacterium]|nr:hypothetical protein [Geminicoccaceae bacterium]
MRRLFYGLGFVLLILAGALGVAEFLHATAGETYRPISLGSIWYSINANSLVGFQALVEKMPYVGPLIWPPIRFLLTLPAWLAAAVPGIVLVLACRPRQRAYGSF